MATADNIRPPARLQALVSWQVNKVSTIGARLTGRRMPSTARSDFAVLAALEETDGLSQADLGRRLGLDRNDINRIVNRLSASRAVTRQSNPADRRRNTIKLTKSGLARLEHIQRHADEAQQELLQGLTSRERQQLNKLLAKILEHHPIEPA